MRQTEEEGLPALHHEKAVTSPHLLFFLHFSAQKRFQSHQGQYYPSSSKKKKKKRPFEGFNLIVQAFIKFNFTFQRWLRERYIRPTK